MPQPELRVMGANGDTRHSWDPHDPQSVAEARTLFEGFLRQGHRAFRMGAAGERGAPMTTFDPSAEQIIVAAQIVGG